MKQKEEIDKILFCPASDYGSNFHCSNIPYASQSDGAFLYRLVKPIILVIYYINLNTVNQVDVNVFRFIYYGDGMLACNRFPQFVC